MNLDRSTKLIFRDCLRLISRMGLPPQNIPSVRKLVKIEFYKNKGVTDEKKINELRSNAIRGISNYLIFSIKEQYKNNQSKQIFDEESDDEEESETTKDEPKN